MKYRVTIEYRAKITEEVVSFYPRFFSHYDPQFINVTLCQASKQPAKKRACFAMLE